MTTTSNHHHYHHLHRHDFFDPASNSSITATHHHIHPPPKSNPRFVSLVLKGIVMVFIISLFFLFLGIAAVALLHFFVAGGAFHRHRLRRRSSSSLFSSHIPDASSSSSPYSAADLRAHLPEIKYAPGFAVKDCAVCLETFKVGERCRVLPACHHMFHSNCVDRWLTKTANCPVCRTSVRLNLGSTGSGDRNCNILWAF